MTLCVADAAFNMAFGIISGKIPGLNFVMIMTGLNIPSINLFQSSGGYGPILGVNTIGGIQAGVAFLEGYQRATINENRYNRLSDLTDRIKFKKNPKISWIRELEQMNKTKRLIKFLGRVSGALSVINAAIEIVNCNNNCKKYSSQCE